MKEAISEIFPYEEIRPVQAEMITTIGDAITAGKHSALEGSTGMGKTIAVLCGILSSPGSAERRIVYCCRTHKQMDRVIEELRALRSKLEGISGISLRGRREMCISPLVRRFAASAADAAQICGMMRKLGKCKFYANMLERDERVAELQELIASQPTLAGELMEICREEEFCPYEIAREALADVKVVAASYVYMLDPAIRPLFLKNMHADLSDLIVVLDEAHNLPDVAIELASDVLSSHSIALAAREAEEFEDELAHRVAEGIGGLIEDLAEKYMTKEEGEELLQGQEFLDAIARMLKREKLKVKPAELPESLKKIGEAHMLHRIRHGGAPRSYIYRLGGFLEAWAATSGEPRYMHLISRGPGRRGQPVVRLEVQALDPRIITQPLVDGSYATISMSGTLVPIEAYRDIVGLPEDTLTAQYPSPFREENVLALVVRGVTTKETYRGPEMYGKLAERVAEVAEAVPANVGVFTASYEVLEGLLGAGLGDRIKKPLLVEEREMSSSRNDRLIRDFKSYAERGGAVLLGVQGGRNSEGGDFPGNQMNAVVVVGIPYGRPTKRTRTMIDYYESQFPGRGMLYGYYLPAHRRMCQAAGRAHRLVTDKAAVVFMDWRVATAFVRRSLPSWLRNRLEVVGDERGQLSRRLRAFFG
jgi:DNA excision repair protein ERCC-2